MLDQRGALPEKEAVGYVIRVAEALGEIHKANILHRDIKPENIIITEDGRVVLIDFGSAREFAAGQTRTMTSWLTPGYAPIEQYGKKGQFNPTTDVYALGATAYHLIAGQLPEQATDRIIQDNLVPLNKVNPRISSRTSDAVIWAMQLDASRRPQSMSDFISALGGNGSAAIAGRPAPTVMVSPGEYESRRKSRKAVWVPVLLIALAVLIIVSLICMNYVTLPFWKSATQTTYQVSPPPSLDQENITSLPQTTPIAWLNGDTSRYNYDLTPSTCKVTVSGPRNIVDNIAWDEVVVGVDLAGLSAGTYDLAVSVSSGLPGNIDISFNPAIVSVAISELSAPAPRRQRGHSGGGSSGGDTGGDEGGDDNGGNGRGPITQP
jgi:serine/threonine protein kinase